MSTLRITVDASIKDLADFETQPCDMKYILNSHIEVDIKCPIGWNMSELPAIIAQSFIETPVAMHIISVTPDYSLLN